MKKMILLAIVLIGIVSLINAQPCKCNPHGFGPFEYSAGSDNQTVRDGHQFSVKCKIPIKLNSSYKCSYTTEICEAKLKAVIKNAAGTVVKSYENFSFPLNYEFETGGNYTIEITPYCLGKKCPPAKFYFNVGCKETPIACTCPAKSGWNPITVYIDKAGKDMKCGSTIELKKDQPFALKGGFKCEGGCEAVLKAELYNITTGETQTFNNFKLDGVNSPFTKEGKYKLLITPNCDGKDCAKCVLYINVN